MKSHGPFNMLKTRGMYTYSCFPPPSIFFIHLHYPFFKKIFPLRSHIALISALPHNHSIRQHTNHQGWFQTNILKPTFSHHSAFLYMKSHTHALGDGSSVFCKIVSWNICSLKCLNLVRTTVLLQIQRTFKRWLSVNLWHKFMCAEMGRQHFCVADVQL